MSSTEVAHRECSSVDNMSETETNVPTPARSPSARNLIKKADDHKRMSIQSTSLTESPFSRAQTTEFSPRSVSELSYEELKKRYEAGQLRAARAEAKGEACLRRINQLTQTVQFMQGDKDMSLRAQAEHIESLQWQVQSLAEENAMHKAGKAHGKGSPRIAHMEATLHHKIQETEKARRDLYNEMETVRREKHELGNRRKELEVQCEVLNNKLKGGSERVQSALNMQQDLKNNLDEQVKLNFALQRDLDNAQQRLLEADSNDNVKKEKAKIEKDLKKMSKELANERDFIKSLKEKFKAKNEECKTLEKKVKDLSAKDGKGKGKGATTTKTDPKQVDQENLVKELYAQLSSANSGKTALAEKVHRAEAHIKLMEENAKGQTAQMQELLARHDEEIFEWKRKLERAADAKTDALNEMRRKMGNAKEVHDQMNTNSLAKNWGVTNKQLTLLTHCLIVGVITLFVMDWMSMLN